MAKLCNRRILAVIPARGGSKGIPRKNLRPLCGRPLISFVIEAARKSALVSRVIVTTDDEEIALFSHRFGAEVINRPAFLGADDIPLDPVIVHATNVAEEKWDEHYEVIVTIQPTSPLVQNDDIDAVICMLKDFKCDTVISAVDDRHLRWKTNGDKLLPEFQNRVNRQLLPPTYKETGAIIACNRDNILHNERVGKRVKLYFIDEYRSIDIDSFYDLWLVESVMKRKKIAIVVSGNTLIGMGHIYRMLIIANEIIWHEIIFICIDCIPEAIEYIDRCNYNNITCKEDELLERVESIKPDLVINDILDTSADYVVKLKRLGVGVINFEDLGLGAEIADLVVNALYPHQKPYHQIFVGPQFFCLRDEFLYLPEKKAAPKVCRCLFTFGGADEGNLACRILRVLSDEILAKEIHVDIVIGPGYREEKKLMKLLEKLGNSKIKVIRSTKRISDYMYQADIAITSAGRTALELASVGTPTIVIAQNLREISHASANSENGFINLGFRKYIKDEEILDTFCHLIDDEALRSDMVEKMKMLDLKSGKTRVINKILEVLNARP